MIRRLFGVYMSRKEDVEKYFKLQFGLDTTDEKRKDAKNLQIRDAIWFKIHCLIGISWDLKTVGEIECLEGGAGGRERDGVYGDDAVVQERPHGNEEDSENKPVYQDE